MPYYTPVHIYVRYDQAKQASKQAKRQPSTRPGMAQSGSARCLFVLIPYPYPSAHTGLGFFSFNYILYARTPRYEFLRACT